MAKTTENRAIEEALGIHMFVVTQLQLVGMLVGGPHFRSHKSFTITLLFVNST